MNTNLRHVLIGFVLVALIISGACKGGGDQKNNETD